MHFFIFKISTSNVFKTACKQNITWDFKNSIVIESRTFIVSINIYTNVNIKIIVVLFAIRCLISFDEISFLIETKQYINGIYSFIGYFGEALAVSKIFMILFNRYLWKISFINRITGEMPILAKQYHGYIVYEDNYGKKHKKKAFMNIKQSYLYCDVEFKTDESSSNSIHASIDEINNERKLIYMYVNEPKSELRKNSPIHYGTVILKINKNKIFGEYYTNRKTCGSIEMTKTDE